MAVYRISRYPREFELRDGTHLTVRPLEQTDCGALLAFFQQIPEEERFFFKDDVSSPAVIDRWTRELDYDRALPLVAVDGTRIVADAVLLRQRGGARSHLAELRVAVDPAYRRRGLGSRLLRELAEIAYDAELDQLLFELVKDVEDEAIEAITFFGAVPLATLPDLVKDPSGRPHDVVYFSLPLGRYWKWAEF